MIKQIFFFFLKTFYPILRLVADVYFTAVEVLFTSYNDLPIWPRKSIDWPRSDDPLLCMSAKSAAKKIRCGEVTSFSLIQAYIDRARKVDPILNFCAVEDFENALEEAKSIDDYLAGLDSSGLREIECTKPLFGVPFTCKDNMAVRGLICTAGDPKNLLNVKSEIDSEVVRRLREAGAIFLATTSNMQIRIGVTIYFPVKNMAESMETENDIYGRTNNPYETKKSVGGSSGGEAAMISSASSLFGIGNDLGGSIRVPAAFCGVFGLKPTARLVPLDGLVSSINDDFRWTVGPMCRYAEDIPFVLDVLTGEYKKQKIKEKTFDFKNLKIFYMLELKILLSQRPTKEVKEAVKKIRHSIIPQMVDFPLIHRVFELWAAMRYTSYNQIPKLEKIVYDTIMLFLGRIGKADATYFELGLDFIGVFLAPKGEEERKFLILKLEKLRQQIDALLVDNGVLVLPMFPNQAPWHDQPKFSVYNLAYTTIFNCLGLPALSVPLGLSENNGMPLSVQLVGPPNSEKLLCAVALELEKGFGGWTIPSANK